MHFSDNNLLLVTTLTLFQSAAIMVIAHQREISIGDRPGIFTKSDNKMLYDSFGHILEKFVKRNALEQKQSSGLTGFSDSNGKLRNIARDFSLKTGANVDERYKAPLLEELWAQMNSVKPLETAIYPLSSKNHGSQSLEQSISTLYSNIRPATELPKYGYGSSSLLENTETNEDADLLTAKPSLWNDAAQFLENLSKKNTKDQDLLLSSTRDRPSILSGNDPPFSINGNTLDFLKYLFPQQTTTSFPHSQSGLPTPIVPSVSFPNFAMASNQYNHGFNMLGVSNFNAQGSTLLEPQLFNNGFNIGVPLESSNTANGLRMPYKTTMDPNYQYGWRILNEPAYRSQTTMNFQNYFPKPMNLKSDWEQAWYIHEQPGLTGIDQTYNTKIFATNPNWKKKSFRYIHERQYSNNGRYIPPPTLKYGLHENEDRIPAREFEK